MAGPAASDGGRVLKAGLLAFGALTWTAPLPAQAAADPLAPLPTQAPAATDPAPAAVIAPPVATPVPAPAVAAPRDWRGVFDAIDSGNWAAARAGIAALPRSPLTALARAELYTAR